MRPPCPQPHNPTVTPQQAHTPWRLCMPHHQGPLAWAGSLAGRLSAGGTYQVAQALIQSLQGQECRPQLPSTSAQPIAPSHSAASSERAWTPLLPTYAAIRLALLMGSTVGLQEGASSEKLAFLSISEEHQHVPATQRARPVHSPTPPPPPICWQDTPAQEHCSHHRFPAHSNGPWQCRCEQGGSAGVVVDTLTQ